MDKPASETSRDRVLSVDEIRSFWSATETHGQAFRDVFRLQLVTAQRREEVLGMRWKEVDLDARVWRIPAERAKNGNATTVPLSDLAVEILVARTSEFTTRPEFVFPSLRGENQGKSAMSGYGKASERVRAAMGLEDGEVKFHDLRRTADTQMAELGVLPHVIEAVLNHTSGVIKGVGRTYNRYDYAKEKREALEKWEARLRAIVG